MTRWQTLVAVCFGLVGCAPSFPRPMTAQELVRFDAGDALVAYLAQPDASPTVCDPRAAGPHVLHWNESVLSSLMDGLLIVLAIWLLSSAPWCRARMDSEAAHATAPTAPPAT